MNEPITKEDKFRDVPPLTVDAMTVSVDLQVQTVDVEMHSREGRAFLLIDEARELRDWLNKVLP